MAVTSIANNQPYATYTGNNAAAETSGSIISGSGISLDSSFLQSGNNSLLLALLALIISLIQQIGQQDTPEDQSSLTDNSDNQDNTQQFYDYPRYNYDIDFWGLNSFGYLPDFWSDYSSPFGTESSSDSWW